MAIVLPFHLQETAASTLVLTAAAATLLLATLFTRSNGNSASKNSKIHSLPGWKPLVGDISEFSRNASRLHEWITEKTLAFNGEPWRINLPGIRTMVVVTSPELVEAALVTHFPQFERGQKQIQVSEDFFGKSLLLSNGDKWQNQRKAAVKFFTAKALRVCLTTTMRKNMLEMYDVIDASIAKRAKGGEPIDLLKLFHEFALQTFAEVGLGVDLKIIGGTEPHPMDTAIEDSTPILMRRVWLPAFVWKLQRWLNVGEERKMARELRSCREWLGSVVEESIAAATARQRSHDGATSAGDVVKSVVELFLDQSTEDVEGLRAEDLVDFIWMFVLTSRSTSALALVWTFLMLAKNPRAEQRLREELASAFPDANEDTEYLTTENVSKLVYLEATIKEVLRLYPVLPMMQRAATEDVEIGDGIVIRKGELVAVHTYAMARLPSLWGPDAAEFKPERWINEKTGELLAVSSNQFTAFGSGPRICIGMKLAMLELRAVVANLVHRYRFTLATPNDCSHVLSVELMPTTPVMMHAERSYAKAAAA